MKKLPLCDLLLCLLLVLFSNNAIADETLYVQPFKAKVFAKPSLSSEMLGAVDSGFQLVSTGKEGNWVKLDYKGKQGFIPAVQTAKTPPLGKSAAQSVDASPRLAARARASSSSAGVAGMKGLTYEDRARVTKGERSDFESLDKVESLKISSDELRSFQLEGGKQ